MNIRQMEIFVAIVRYGNFSNAAKKLYLSQPAISANIDMLEKDLGCKLLLRQGRKATLTEKGIIFYEYCLNVMAMTEKTTQQIKESPDISGSLNIISSFVPGLYLLPNYMKEFRQKYNVKFNVAVKNSRESYDGVLSSKYDIGLVGSVIKNDSILQKRIFSDNMVLAAPDTPFYREFALDLEASQIKDFPFIMRSWGSETLTIAERALEKNGVKMKDLNVVAEFDSGEAVSQAIIQGLGVSIMPKVCIDNMAGILWFNIKNASMMREFFVIMPNTDYILPRIQEFYDFLPEV